MAWRFKASKYKNAAPIVPKPEVCVRDICVGSYQTYGNNIAASAAFMAFNWEHAGSSLAVLPIDDCGRKSKTMPLLHGHTDTVTDLHFSPFHDGLLATGSQDCLVKIWFIPEKGLESSLTEPECTFSHKQRRVETVGFHPAADCLLHSTSSGNVTLWDISQQKEVFSNNEHPDVIQSLSWKQDGTLMTTSCKDKIVRIMDPRISDPITMQALSHQSIKDSRVVWLGDQQRILTTGFDSSRLRQIIIRDLRKFDETEKTLELDCSTGILIPLYDADTNMLFLAGKGDTTISYMEVTDNAPYLIEGLRHNGEQTKGACLVPKRALRIMEGEVNRIMQLTSNSVIPIMYQVPRKTYRDFHSDLYPDTNGYKTDLSVQQWLNGVNVPVPKMSLDPAKRENGDQPIVPRLGPKPFTSSSCSGDISFDKVFSVPQAPGNESLEHDHLNNTSTESSESSIDEQKQSDNSEKNLKINDGNEEKEHYNNGNHGTTNDDNNNNNNNNDHQNDDNVDDVDDIDVVDIDIDNNNLINKDSAADGDIIRNAKNKNEDTNESQTFMDTADDKIDTNLERLSMNRCSIAERRKIYENRSLSSQEERTVMAPPQSPLPSSKKELIQNRMESIQNVDDNKTKFHHHHLEHSKTFDDATNGHQNNRSSKHNNGGGGGGGGIMDIKKNSLKNQQSEPNSATKRTSTVFGKVSKFRHLKGTPGHKSTHIENIRNISRQIPGECNGFHANHQRVAVPISGPGGKIAVYELNKPGRLPDGVIPSLVNSSNIMDFQWDPFDSHKLVVACDDGIVKIWNIPENGLLEPTNTCDSEFPAHSDKIYFIRFHPLAQNVLLTASYDMTMKLWDLNTMTEKICLQGHTEQIFDFAWSPCGELGASVCKDGKIRIFNPRKSLTAILEGNGPIGTRGARIAWALGGQYILCTGFDKVSERQISIYKLTNLSTPLNVVGLDVSPAILMLFYDEDSSTVLLTGRGDSTIYAFEITDEAPHICPLSHHRCPTLHQGLSFLTKNYCDVVAVEFAKALRLTNNTIEPLSFTVPRIKTELFQDDLFPPTRITWSPTMSSVEWFSLKPCTVKKINLQPDGMECLTTVQQAEKQNTKKTEIAQTTSQNVPLYPHNRLGFSSESDKAKQKEIQQSVSARMEYTTKLEQDDMEGVEEKEWDE